MATGVIPPGSRIQRRSQTSVASRSESALVGLRSERGAGLVGLEETRTTGIVLQQAQRRLAVPRRQRVGRLGPPAVRVGHLEGGGLAGPRNVDPQARPVRGGRLLEPQGPPIADVTQEGGEGIEPRVRLIAEASAGAGDERPVRVRAFELPVRSVVLGVVDIGPRAYPVRLRRSAGERTGGPIPVVHIGCRCLLGSMVRGGRTSCVSGSCSASPIRSQLDPAEGRPRARRRRDGRLDVGRDDEDLLPEPAA